MRWGLACLLAASACSVVSDQPTGTGGAVLAQLHSAYNLLVDDDSAYVTGGNGTNGTGIVRVPLDGGASSMMIILNELVEEAMDDSTIYFSTYSADGGAIMSMPKDGGAPTLIAAVASGRLAVDDSYVYANSGMSLIRVAKTGGTPEVLASTGDVTSFVIDDSYVYWIDLPPLDGGFLRPANVLRVAKDGGPPETLASDAWGISALGIDDGGVYWGALTNDESGRLVRFDKASAATTTVCTGNDCLAPEAIAADGTHVFWTGVDRIDVANPDADGGFTPVVRTSSSVPDMKVHAGKVFWLDVDYDAGATNLRVTPEP